jgi:hypothetical protein
MLAPVVYGSLGPDADIVVDHGLDQLHVTSPWGGFVITRKAVEDGSWKAEAGRLLAQLRAKRKEAQPEEKRQ